MTGTPQYMAREQFEGREADARSDIWAFGAVLYEMLTGRKAFQAQSYSSLVGAILATDPAPMALRPFTPSWLESRLRRCLKNDPEYRYEVHSPIGAGGTGEVYKARIIASLSHPNICVLHDIGTGYMVMDLIEGESLAARIEEGAIPLDQAVRHSTQFADAIGGAHRAGVTHRDIKAQYRRRI